jgi:single-stranded-DNA-specific exonuclease
MTYFSNKKSLKNYLWRINEYDEKKAIAIKQKYDFSEILSKLIAIKNIDINKVNDFLSPTIKNTLGNPLTLKDIEKGVKVVYDSIINNEKIAVFGDYDVDGITSTSLMKKYFAALNIDIVPYIPNRILEGYGLNIVALKKLKDKNVNLIITVDCGISSKNVCKEGKEMGLKIVITDHHLCNNDIPDVEAVINPNRNSNEKNDYNNLAGVGVAYLFLIVLNKYLRDKGFFKKNNIKEPDLLKYLDLVALGTVCDVMPLTGLNRAFVSQGLRIIKKRENIGISSLIDNSNIEEEVNVYHLGFIIGPKLNATGRVGESILSSKLLYEKDKIEVSLIAKKLEIYNVERQNLEATMLIESIKIIRQKSLDKENIIFLENDSWHEGIIGIIASRIKDKYDRPVFIATKNTDHYKTSCRSVKGIDIGTIILEAKMKNLIIDGGGHAMAGGFNFKLDKLEEVKNFLNDRLTKIVDNFTNTKERNIDLKLECKSINLQLAKDIEKLGPFGVNNTKPKILLKDIIIIKTNVVGKNQDCIKLIIADKDGIKTTHYLSAMSFRTKKDDAIYSHLLKRGNVLSLLGEININRYKGKESIQFIIEDVTV